jgi:hypothetical protein
VGEGNVEGSRGEDVERVRVRVCDAVGEVWRGTTVCTGILELTRICP